MTKYRTNTTPLFPDFHLSTLRRTPRSAQQKRREELDELSRKRLDHLANLFKDFIPADELAPKAEGTGSRERHYSQSNTFWAFLQQVWSGDGSCQEAVHRIIELAEAKGMKTLPSTNTSAYTQARKRLVLDDLWSILYHGAGAMELEVNEVFPDERPWIVATLMRMCLRRWRIEVVFRDIKCSMGWELMRCKSPEMIQREFAMMLIGYNAVRYLQLRAANREGLSLDAISFKSALQVVRIWEKRFRESKSKHRESTDLMLQQIASVLLPYRPGRAEPRVKKRRPKKVRLMTKPRRELKREMLEKVAA